MGEGLLHKAIGKYLSTATLIKEDGRTKLKLMFSKSTKVLEDLTTYEIDTDQITENNEIMIYPNTQEIKEKVVDAYEVSVYRNGFSVSAATDEVDAVESKIREICKICGKQADYEGEEDGTEFYICKQCGLNTFGNEWKRKLAHLKTLQHEELAHIGGHNVYIEPTKNLTRKNNVPFFKIKKKKNEKR